MKKTGGGFSLPSKKKTVAMYRSVVWERLVAMYRSVGSVMMGHKHLYSETHEGIRREVGYARVNELLGRMCAEPRPACLQPQPHSATRAAPGAIEDSTLGFGDLRGETGVWAMTMESALY